MQDIIIYKAKDNQIEVQFDGDTAWLSQGQLSELFQQTKQNISLHINNCFREGELDKGSVVKESLTTALNYRLSNACQQLSNYGLLGRNPYFKGLLRG
ncbi:hypothetical protein LCGC14_0266020 [marine sediment metagenome]|uniref:Uncharacterized protein n=1 Tax=marine sediment metagenome TaxID=412755 RepID=A0A0F9U4S7_9ZZZZ|nr:hypothetical protein [Maribacter sp.]HDZ03516.1 hypothetical protein [Maribacter sp.]HEA79457.1 hypothetical protein [Maribacter sp.]|tara:strand:+ start:1702 stop:1995 length:294 start_codon:yes stop_codon:yes gene_type:complete